MAGILDEFLLIFKPQVQGSGFTKLNRQIKQTTESMFNMKNLFRGFFAFDLYSGIKQFGQSLIQTSKDVGAMEARFYAITHSEQKAGEELQWVFDLAQKTAMPLKQTADAYSIFYAATQKSIGNNGARQVFQDWTEVGRVLHLSSYQFERVTYALREMASKGAIYSQDLRMQIGTHVPNAMGLAQKAVNELGITGNDWFEVFQKKAKGNQDLINQFIVLFSKFAKEQFASPDALAKAMKKPDSALQALTNTWQLFQITITKSGFSDDLVKALGTMNWLLAKLTGHAKGLYKTLKALLGVVGILTGVSVLNGLITIVSNFKTFFEILTWVKKANIAKQMLDLASVISDVKGLGTISKILSGLFSSGGLVALFSSPPGWILAGVLAIVGAVFWFKNTFPNAWLGITNYISMFIDYCKRLIYQIGIALGYVKTGEGKKDTTGKDIANTYKDIQKHGGLSGNTKYEDPYEMVRALEKARHMTRNDANPLWRPLLQKVPAQQKFNIQVSMALHDVHSAQDIYDALDKNKPTFTQWWGSIFKGEK